MRTLLMGILNVTPDSFSDGGRWFDTEAAVERGRALIAEGADLIDIGGESTRPGSVRPLPAEELRRVLPVVRALAQDGARISVDTMRSEVAAACVDAGAVIINDVSGGLADEAMLATVADLGVEYVTMHWRGHGSVMNSLAHYDDVVRQVREELQRSVDAALAAGIGPERLRIDPGFGFSKESADNWRLLRHLDQIQAMGFPVLVGVSRKRFIADLPGGRRDPQDRDAATAAVTALCAERGIWAVRTHAVRLNRDVIDTVARFTEQD